MTLAFTPEERSLDAALHDMVRRSEETAAAGLDGFPHYADPADGTWITTPDGFWTGGFWLAELWLVSFCHGFDGREPLIRDYLARLKPRVHSDSVFRAFLFYYGAAAGERLLGDEEAGALALEACKSLARSYDEANRLIPLGTEAEESGSVGKGEINIDALVASPLLLWGWARTGNTRYRDIALAHAHRTIEFCMRPDGSIIQSASFDMATGAVLRRYTHKGFSETSTWTRAQAWGMLFLALSAQSAPDERWLAERCAAACDWWLGNVPPDLVAPWDFDAAPGAWRDTSGTAIAAAGLLKAADVVGDRAKAVDYARVAHETVRRLAALYLTPTHAGDTRPGGILTDGCFDPKRGTAVAHELIWGDYFLLESLALLTGWLPGERL